jgi:Cu+-exporting ATPase
MDNKHTFSGWEPCVRLKRVIFTTQVRVGKVMCGGCEATVGGATQQFFEDQKSILGLPKSAEVARGPAISSVIRQAHNIEINITVDQTEMFEIPVDQALQLQQGFQAAVASDIAHEPPSTTEEELALQANRLGFVNWPNILVNLLALGVILLLHFLCPPSVFLTIVCTMISFLSTGFSARYYLLDFFRNRRFSNMSGMVSSGWFLALVHTLYHAIKMPLASDMSMIFMSFLMPILLILTINCMDELKRWVEGKIDEMKCSGRQSLFPQMNEQYELIDCEALSELKGEEWAPLLDLDFSKLKNRGLLAKSALSKKMVIVIPPNKSVPVDCIVLKGEGLVDESHVTGEHTKQVKPGIALEASAINLTGDDLIVWTKTDVYGSRINNILVQAHVPQERAVSSIERSSIRFSSVYSGLIIAGLLAALCIPLSLGALTFSLALKNMTSILFTVCPCTIALAEKLSGTLLWYQLSRYGVVLRQESLLYRRDEMHTVIFDKTGTLTTGRSKVSQKVGIKSDLWRCIYLLEKKFGRGHPIAHAIEQDYERKKGVYVSQFPITLHNLDSRGLYGTVEGHDIHIGNSAFLKKAGIDLPAVDQDLADTVVYVAQKGIYQGYIRIEHEQRAGVRKALEELKKTKKIIMLTGDRQEAATAFNRGVLNGVFNEVYGSRPEKDMTPSAKKAFIEQLAEPQGVWFVGDGINDSECSRYLTSKGGVSCAMHLEDKSSFFSDLSLNGSLDYLLLHHQLAEFMRKNLLQNKMLLCYGALAFLSFILSFAALSMSLPSILPLLIMVSTTGMVLCNSYRMVCVVDQGLGQGSTLGAFLASDVSIALLVGGNALFLSAILMASVHATKFAFPSLVLGAGFGAASVCLLSGGILLGVMALLFIGYALTNTLKPKVSLDRETTQLLSSTQNTAAPSCVDDSHPVCSDLFPVAINDLGAATLSYKS